MNAASAVIYARYSSQKQTEQSIEGQLHDAYDFAKREGYSVVGEYIDRAISGTSDSRPDFQRMIRDSEKKQFKTVIVWKLDRFARNRYDAAIYRARLKKNGVRIVSVKESITDSPEGIILEGMLESMAEYYSANLAQNVRRGLRESWAKNRYAGGHVPYGYKLQEGRLVRDELAAPVVKWVFEQYAAGVGRSAIVAELKARGVLSPDGLTLGHSSYTTVLRNPAYYGHVVKGGMVLDCCPEPIITKDLFDRVQQRLEAKRRAPAAAKAKTDYLLQGKAFCGHCGAPMVGECGRSKQGVVYHYYACAEKKKRHGCHKHNERKAYLEWYAVEQAQAYISDPDRRELIVSAVLAEYAAEFGADRTDEMRRAIERLDRQLANLVDSLADAPKSARPRIYTRMEELEAQKADLSADLARLQLAQGIRLSADEIRAWLKRITAGDATDPAFQRTVIDTFINSIYVFDDRIVIFFNIRGGKQVSYTEMQTALDPEDDPGGEGSDLDDYGLPCSTKSEHRVLTCRESVGIVVLRDGQ